MANSRLRRSFKLGAKPESCRSAARRVTGVPSKFPVPGRPVEPRRRPADWGRDLEGRMIRAPNFWTAGFTAACPSLSASASRSSCGAFWAAPGRSAFLGGEAATWLFWALQCKFLGHRPKASPLSVLFPHGLDEIVNLAWLVSIGFISFSCTAEQVSAGGVWADGRIRGQGRGHTVRMDAPPEGDTNVLGPYKPPREGRVRPSAICDGRQLSTSLGPRGSNLTSRLPQVVRGVSPRGSRWL